MDLRQLRGKEIVKTLGKYIKKNEQGWLVPSQTTNDMYSVNELFQCSCPDAQNRGTTCKHAYAVRFYLQAETASGQVVHKQRLTHKQAWSAYDAGQTNEIRLFDELLKDLVQAVQEPEYSFGRPRLSKRDVLFCCIQKAFSQLSARRASSLFGNAVGRKQIGNQPHFTSVNGYLRDETLTPILHGLLALSALPLKGIERDFAVDSTGFRTTNFGQYVQEKYDIGAKHGWIKCHAAVGTKTNVITSIRITDENGADCPQMPALIRETANGGFVIDTVTADKGYVARYNHNVVAEFGGVAYIPFKEGTTGKAGGSQAWKKAYLLFQLHQSEFYQHYGLRQNVESTFSAVKRKFGDGLKAKTTIAQHNELLCKLISYNLSVVIHEMFEIGITPNFKSEEKVADLNKKSASETE